MIFTLSTGNNFKSIGFLDSGFSTLNLTNRRLPGRTEAG